MSNPSAPVVKKTAGDATAALETREDILKALCDSDALRDANEIMRLAVLLLTRGHCASLAAVEDIFRRLALNARLVACPFRPDAVPSGVACQNPFCVGASSNQSQSTRNCAFFVSLNLEGEQAAARECAEHGCQDERDNVNRLRGDCGFLVLQCAQNNGNAWERALLSYGGDVQRADERATLLTGVSMCKTCGRFATHVRELRELGCCSNALVCSERCWASHVQEEHADVIACE